MPGSCCFWWHFHFGVGVITVFGAPGVEGVAEGVVDCEVLEVVCWMEVDVELLELMRDEVD